MLCYLNYIILYYIIMVPPSYMWSVVDRSAVLRHKTVLHRNFPPVILKEM